MWKSYDAAQGWIVVTLVGAAIGLNAALLNIITEWLSDIKIGYCETAFYLNENFCCWGDDNGTLRDKAQGHANGTDTQLGCPAWHRWTGFEPANYLLYIVFGVSSNDLS